MGGAQTQAREMRTTVTEYCEEHAGVTETAGAKRGGGEGGAGKPAPDGQGRAEEEKTRANARGAERPLSRGGLGAREKVCKSAAANRGFGRTDQNALRNFEIIWLTFLSRGLHFNSLTYKQIMAWWVKSG